MPLSNAFPGALNSFGNPTESTQCDDSGFELDEVITQLQDAAESHEAKLGTGASTPVASRVLGADGTGTSSWRQVATGDVATDAITQAGSAVGSTSGPTTTSSTPADIPEMSVTLTTTGGDLLCWFSGSFSNTNTSVGVFFRLVLDGTLITGSSRTISIATANFVHPTSVMVRVTGVSAGSHTVKAQMSTNGGTAKAEGTERSLVVMERKR